MALDGDIMGTAVNSALQALSAAEHEDPEKVWKTACSEIVAHIVANTVVATTVPGVGLLDSLSGPVTGAASGTGTVS